MQNRAENVIGNYIHKDTMILFPTSWSSSIDLILIHGGKVIPLPITVHIPIVTSMKRGRQQVIQAKVSKGRNFGGNSSQLCIGIIPTLETK